MEELMAEIMAKMDVMSALWYRLAEQSSPPSSTSVFTSNADFSSLCSASPSTASPRFEHVVASEYSLLAMPDSEIEAEPVATSLIPSPTSAPPQDADPEPSSGVTESPVSTGNHLGIVFDADGRGSDRLTYLPDSLLRNIVSRLPIKDAARTAVLSRRWSLIKSVAPLLIGSVNLAVVHLNSNCFCGLVPTMLDKPQMLHELDISNICLVGTADQEVSTNIKAATASPTSPTPSSPSATPWGADPAVLFAFSEYASATHARCSTIGSYQVGITLMPAATCLASPLSTSTVMPLVSATIDKYLLTTWSTSSDHTQGNRIPKPPWLLGIEVSRSWSERMQLICGFLLEISPWCSVSANYLLDYSGVQFWMHGHGLECLQGCSALGMISPLLLLRHPVLSSSRCKPCIDSNCAITFDPGITFLSTCIVRFTISDVQTMSALLLRREQLRGIVLFQKSREEFLTTVELDIFTSKCLPHYFSYLNEIKAATILSIVLFESEVDESKLHWLHFLESAAQVADGNIRGVSALFLYNLSQMWLFTEILAAGKCLLLSGEIYLITYSWSKYQISFPDLSASQQKYRVICRLYKPSALAALIICMHLVSSRVFQLEGNSAQLDLQEGNLTHGHCQLLKYVVVYMVIASQMAFESIKSGGLIAQVNLWLLWTNMSAYQLPMLVWLLSHYKENVELIPVASSKGSLNWVWLSPLNRIMPSYIWNLPWDCVACVRAMMGCDQLDLEKGLRTYRHLVLLTHFGGHSALTMVHQPGILIEFSDSIDTYWTPHDIKYNEAVIRVQIQMSELWLKDSVTGIHQSILCQPTIQANCIDIAEGAVRADIIAYQTLPLSTHIAVPTVHMGSSLLRTIYHMQILEIVEYYLPCKGNRVVPHILMKWVGLLLVDISIWEDANQVPWKLISTTAWGQAVF